MEQVSEQDGSKAKLLKVGLFGFLLTNYLRQ